MQVCFWHKRWAGRCVCYYNVIRAVITARTDTLGGGKDGDGLHKPINTHAGTCTQSSNQGTSNKYKHKHTNDHLSFLNLALNEPLRLPITDSRYFMGGRKCKSVFQRLIENTLSHTHTNILHVLFILCVNDASTCLQELKSVCVCAWVASSSPRNVG